MLSRSEFERLPLFIASMSRWDGPISSASLALAKVFGRRNEVYYIDYPYSYADLLRERKLEPVRKRMPALLYGRDFLKPVTGQAGNLQAVTPRLVWPTYSLRPGAINNVLSHRNNLTLAGAVKRVLKKRNLKDYIFINSFNPNYLPAIAQYLQPSLSVYQSRDAIEEVKESWLSRENECVQHYDLTLATSRRLCRNIAARNNRTVHYFPNGGDVALFRQALNEATARPPELAAVKTPIIGYTGAVCQRIDYELLVKLARSNPDKTIVMVGPRQDRGLCAEDLDAIPNLLFTGPKKISELPLYLRHFDCAIIPFRYNNFTAGIYPLKINEYLGAGRAVVTTNFSEDIASFSSQVYLAQTHDDFLRMVQEALQDNSEARQQERLKAAAANAWEYRVEYFWELAWLAYQRKSHSEGFSKKGLHEF